MSTVLWIIFLTLPTLFTIAAVYIFYNHVKKIKLILQLPGPKRHPVLGNILDVAVDQDTLNKNLRNWAKRFSPIYVLMGYPYYSINITGPDDAEQVISTMKHSSKSFFYGFLYGWLGDGLLTSTGITWQTRRKLLTPAFHFNILQQFVGVFDKEARKLVTELEKLSENKEVDVVPLISQFALYSINETSMGTILDEKDTMDKEYKNALGVMSEIIAYRLLRPWMYPHFIHYYLTNIGKTEFKVTNILHKFTNRVINNRKKEATNVDSYSKRKRMAMIDLLISAEKDGIIDMKGIQDEINTFMFEGHDTTAVSLCFSLMLFASHKHVQEQIVQEINEVLPDPNEEVTIQKLNELKFLERCIKESLRLYPSVSFISRILGEDFRTSSNVVVPKGTVANIHIYDLHRNPKIYPDPEKFDPDRFLPDNVLDRHPFAYIPFSAGPRNCIGQRFAMLEMKTVLSSILRKFILEPIDTPENVALNLEMVIRPKNGLRIKFIRRDTESIK